MAGELAEPALTRSAETVPGSHAVRGNGEGESVALTGREAQVLQLVVQGHTNKAVAVHLGITERGVRHHLENIYHKLGVSGRAQAIAWALRQGLA